MDHDNFTVPNSFTLKQGSTIMKLLFITRNTMSALQTIIDLPVVESLQTDVVTKSLSHVVLVDDPGRRLKD